MIRVARTSPARRLRELLATLGLCVGLLTAAASVAQVVPGCGTLDSASQFGPFDYRDMPDKADELEMVESFHFTSDVELLIKGKSATIIGDLDYTLRAFPNHHRALNSLSNYVVRGGRQWPNPAIPSAECYFRRAMAFRPEDAMVRMVYANHLVRIGDMKAAREQYEEALRLDPEAPEINYNAGLYFLKQGDLVRARQLAQVAYGGGYPLPGLKKLIDDAENRRRP